MRGKPLSASTHHRVYRITPADAGKTEIVSQSPRDAEDHPRGCGENRVRLKEHLCGLGSPPRMRGKPFADAFGEPVHGITPADAGKTTRSRYYTSHA